MAGAISLCLPDLRLNIQNIVLEFTSLCLICSSTTENGFKSQFKNTCTSRFEIERSASISLLSLYKS